jgi:hypothetical protein
VEAGVEAGHRSRAPGQGRGPLSVVLTVLHFFAGKDRTMGCNCSDLERENWRLQNLLRRHGIEDSREDDFDEDHFGEDEYNDSLEEPSEEPSRWDEPSGDRLDVSSSRRPGGSAYPRDANKEYRRYARDVSGGRVFGEDVWRFAAGEKFKADSPLERATMAVSRFSRAHR